MTFVLILVVVVVVVALGPVFNKRRLANGVARAAAGGSMWEMELSVQDSELSDPSLFPNVQKASGFMGHALGALSGWTGGHFRITKEGVDWDTNAKGHIAVGGVYSGTFSFTWDQIQSISLNAGPVIFGARGGSTRPMQINLVGGQTLNVTYGGGMAPTTPQALSQAIQNVAPGKVA